MSIDLQSLRLDGIYPQNNDGDLMLRAKLPGGVLSSIQAETLADLAETLSNGLLHLTTRGSIELHWLRYEQLDTIFRRFAAVGLTSRGACGGAVRGVSCSVSDSGAGFTAIQLLARRLQRHFTGNPHFEGLPKKFKIGIAASSSSGRHLIQDVGLVLVGCSEGVDLYDVWIAGGLGREPRPGFRLREAFPAPELLPLVEAIVHVYRQHAPAPKRLKYLAASLGEEALGDLIAARQSATPQHFAAVAGDVSLTPSPSAPPVEVPVFAGELRATALRQLAELARHDAGGALVVSPEQSLLLFPPDGAARERLGAAINAAGLGGVGREAQVTFRVCPGNHECKMGLAATRDTARAILAAMGETATTLSWAISGCANACSQPQLADVGIIARKRVNSPAGVPQPHFELCRRRDAGFGTPIAGDLDSAALLAAISALDV